MHVDNSLSNEDLAPVALERRTWTMWSIAALWVGMCICIPTYMLAASLMEKGMYWWQAMITIALANCIVLVPMALNAHAGTKYGIPFPVLLRSSFGVVGANIPALMRAFVACGWFGIQTWIGGEALHGMLLIMGKLLHFPFPDTGALPVLGITLLQFICFLIFWLINIVIILKGIDCIKWLENVAAPFLILTGLWLLFWSVNKAGGFSVVLSDATVARIRGSSTQYDFWKVFFPSLTGMIGFWATLSLNIPDFTRYARSQRDQFLGQVISLPTTMTLFSFIGIAVTAATVVIYNEVIWNPVTLLTRLESPLAMLIALLALLVATLSTNIAANVVSPANDFSNLMPKRISFKMGGMITGVIGVVIMPWRLVGDLGSYIYTWLIGYGALLGAIGGIMICDYYILRKTKLDLPALYDRHGRYSYNARGINWRAVIALFVGIIPNVPGFLHAASGGAIAVPQFFIELYTYAWFVGFFVAGVVHFLLSKRAASS